ncbi:glutathione S-transferase family protein [Desmonostoc muscorum LEGE 12446]|uniref:Glutathione S-transferase family protein n=1 Tax=Desmonostoc muscorum LEGE 12446 TaxID=1828758 RepID=A0A8J6ZWQ7_DESMC|nr:glutathione S-transferase family protein [Desmonostoc muscorum]MCF2151113.1 glutathione S-transferase family protein [Desmonostoc muscorum LEGE 12446]
MLKFYYNPFSPNARRVWLTLLEKEIPFESVLVKLDGDQFQPEFVTINPFHNIPVVVDDGFRVVESLAIMDYLEAKYPTPAMLPSEPQALATVRMVQLVTGNELFPQIISLIYESEDSPQATRAKQHIDKVLQFLTQALGDRSFFGSEQLTLADIVAGIGILSLPNLGINLSNYTKLYEWSERLMQRPAWQKTKLSAEEFELFKGRVRTLVTLRRNKANENK